MISLLSDLLLEGRLEFLVGALLIDLLQEVDDAFQMHELTHVHHESLDADQQEHLEVVQVLVLQVTQFVHDLLLNAKHLVD